MASVPTGNLPKHTCMNHWNPILMDGFHSMPRVGVQLVSPKSCRRWDSTCDRMMVIAQIDESSTPLDSRHRDSARVALYFGSMEKGSFVLSILETRFLLS